MDYYQVEESLQVLFERFIPLSECQRGRIHEICLGVMLAGKSQLTGIAKWLKQDTHQGSRVQWLRRTLQSPYLSHEYVYQPLIKQALHEYKPSEWHLVIDSTHLEHQKTDVLMISLNFRHRAIPLIWKFVPYGSTGYETQIDLIEACRGLLPDGSRVIFHGDSEFSAVRLMQYLTWIGWDYILGQRSAKHYRQGHTGQWQALNTLPVTKTRPCYVSNVEFTREYAYGPVNLFAFHQVKLYRRRIKREIVYCVTSLPISRPVRRIGHRRWGIECCFKDFKSSGWHLHLSHLSHPDRREGLFTVLSTAYLWATCLGRWLCKTGQRQLVDDKPQRQLSLFRIGWDWLVHTHNMNKPCPTLLTLYQ